MFICVEWFSYIIYLNFLWVLFTLVGLLVFGIFPSTTAMFAVTRKWVNGERDISIWAVFWRTYVSCFWKINLLGSIFVGSGVVIFADFFFLRSTHSLLGHWIHLGLLPVMIVYFVTLLYIFPVYVHYDTKTFQYLRNSFVIGLRQPLQTLALLLILYVFFSVIRGIVPFFCISTMSVLIMWIANRGFRKFPTSKQTEL
ncbi:YesL family protein [Alicyclobacillus fastidiosus]|uniref:YesL family protein n=1 Tax=Alicyclobacillus fastidiosus TaxID=392011 RepID=UPI0034D3F049